MEAKGSTLQNLINGIKFRLNNTFSSTKRKVGLSPLKEIWLKHRKVNTPGTFQLKGRTIHYLNGLELLHSLDEIFVQEIYKQTSPNLQPNIIDCGANIGLSVIFCKDLFPEARITAFEPDALNFELLKKNTQGFSGIELHKKAVWKENTVLNFINDGSLSSKIGSSDSAEIVEVQAIRLRDLLNEPVDFLKIDIEGAEYEVLKDCKDHLNFIRNIFIEYHGTYKENYQLNEILSWIVQAGFTYYIKEAAVVHQTPFMKSGTKVYDLQLNIFCFR